MKMGKRFLKKMKDLLTEQRNEIADKIAGSKKPLTIDNIDVDGDDVDFFVGEQELLLSDAFSARDREKLLMIDAALGRIIHGDYGVCQECAELISTKRLEALPFTTLCIDCCEHAERSNKQTANIRDERVIRL